MKVRRVVPHPMYNLGVAHDNDVALFQVTKKQFMHMCVHLKYVLIITINYFQLKTRVKFHEHLLPVCLPPANHELVPGTPCTVIGWGKKEDKDGKYTFHFLTLVHQHRVVRISKQITFGKFYFQHLNMNLQ